MTQDDLVRLVIEQKQELETTKDQLAGETKGRREVEGLVEGLGEELEAARGRVDEMMNNEARM